ncbi:MAG: low specificity L-threonine aldolase [Vicinamibacterales bacterium]
MAGITRRGFVERAGIAAGACAVPWPATAGAAPPPADHTVHMVGDGVGLSPRAYAALLAELSAGRDVVEDSYLLGGEVEAFERHWAALLGKETAVFMPSGTLANHLALRALAGARRRVVVPETSHIYNDTGDACQTLSALTLLPLGPGAAGFTRADVEAVLARTASGRVAADIGAIAIESPVRRMSGQQFDWDELQRIAALARDRGIGLHLDGARMFIAAAYTGRSPAALAAPFDTVYVSLWKYFNCGQGAILAGPRRVLDGMFHTRRMFGGNLAVGWPAAVVARHYMDGFVERLRAAIAVSEDLYRALQAHGRAEVERIPDGTNLARVRFRGVEPAAVARRLAERGIRVPAPAAAGVITLAVNETWTRSSAGELVAAFEHALG